ncbi:tektin-1-like [Chelonus insularis]|uniref:tektin-1-like n=1 Tax=Chelonus insularis TaxID=460826 RepID=UPI00158C79F8|nr:tektin-1-like [Chelonus insularis]
MTEVIYRKTAKNIKFKPCKTFIDEQLSNELASSLNDEKISNHDSEANELATNLKEDHDVSQTFQLLSSQYSLSNSKPSEAAVENTSSLDRWTKSAEQIGTRPAVDKYTLSRYSPLEWRLHNHILSEEIKEPVDNAKNMTHHIHFAENEIFSQVDKNKLETEIHLKDRARIIYNWKRTLEHNIKETVSEIENVQKIIKQLVKSNHTVTLVKNINHDIQQMRNKRLGPDLVHDSVSEEITKEGALCKEILDLYTKIINEGKKYIQELKGAKQKLEQDWSDKKDTYNIEIECLGMKNGSPTVHWKPGCAQLPDRQYHLTGHEYVSKDNIVFNQTAITRARLFCKDTKDMVKKAVRNLKLQADKVDVALKKRNYETQKAYKYLENNLIECLKSISNLEATIAKTSKSIRKLDGPMKCAQTKLHMRLQRNNIEQCRDFSQFCLIDEVKDISAGVSALDTQTKNAEMVLEDLKKIQNKLQNELLIKQNTLWVDQNMCQNMRAYFPSDQGLHGY